MPLSHLFQVLSQKTVNVPKEATAEEIQKAYVDSWRLGTKAVSIYRDGSKRTQPLNTSRDAKTGMIGSSRRPRWPTGPPSTTR